MPQRGAGRASAVTNEEFVEAVWRQRQDLCPLPKLPAPSSNVYTVITDTLHCRVNKKAVYSAVLANRAGILDTLKEYHSCEQNSALDHYEKGQNVEASFKQSDDSEDEYTPNAAMQNAPQANVKTRSGLTFKPACDFRFAFS